MKIVIVSYLNTFPFLWGIERVAPELWEHIVLATPDKCAQMMLDSQADVSLVPVAQIPKIYSKNQNIKLITDYCISAEGPVRTVVLLSMCPVENITKIHLDTHSRTSVELARILSEKKWNISPIWSEGIPDVVGESEAVVAIGDKVFEMEDKFPYNYDLAKEWSDTTKLPVIFAAWIAANPEGEAIEERLNEAFKYANENIEKAVKEKGNLPNFALDYLTRNIKYSITPEKLVALELFLKQSSMGQFELGNIIKRDEKEATERP